LFHSRLSLDRLCGLPLLVRVQHPTIRSSSQPTAATVSRRPSVRRVLVRRSPPAPEAGREVVAAGSEDVAERVPVEGRHLGLVRVVDDGAWGGGGEGPVDDGAGEVARGEEVVVDGVPGESF
jgi:hypothetical protein